MTALKTGYSKVIKYRRYDVRNPIGVNSGQSFDNSEISSSSIAVRKVYGLLQPSLTSTTKVNGPLLPSPLLTTGKIDNANLWLHNNRVFDIDITGDQQRWDCLTRECVYDGTDNGPLTYQELLQRYNILVMNVERKQDMINKDSQTTVRVRFTATAAGSITFMIEEERQMEIAFGEKGISKVISSAAIRG